MKTCCRCNKSKPLSEFYIHRRYGREEIRAACKKCTNKANKKWRDSLSPKRKEILKNQIREWALNNKEKFKVYSRESRMRNPIKYLSNARNWKSSNPDKTKTHSLARKLNWRSEKPKKCSDCGQEGILEKHHPDYKQPLKVVWLCKKCHEKIHHGGKYHGNQGLNSSIG